MARRLHGGPKGYRNWTWECSCGAKGWKPVTHSTAYHNGRVHNKELHEIDEPVNIIRWIFKNRNNKKTGGTING